MLTFVVPVRHPEKAMDGTGPPGLHTYSDVCDESCRFGIFPMLSVKSSSAGQSKTTKRVRLNKCDIDHFVDVQI